MFGKRFCHVKIEAFHQRPQQGFTPNVIVILIENKHLKSLPASCRHSFVVEKVELVVGRPFSRVYLAQSHVTMNISRDF